MLGQAKKVILSEGEGRFEQGATHHDGTEIYGSSKTIRRHSEDEKCEFLPLTLKLEAFFFFYLWFKGDTRVPHDSLQLIPVPATWKWMVPGT